MSGTLERSARVAATSTVYLVNSFVSRLGSHRMSQAELDELFLSRVGPMGVRLRPIGASLARLGDASSRAASGILRRPAVQHLIRNHQAYLTTLLVAVALNNDKPGGRV